MPVACRIDPEQWYDTGAIVLALNIPSATLARARREGRLRFCRKGKRTLYCGHWIINWLTDTPRESEVQPCRN
jgi:hypothetical protein